MTSNRYGRCRLAIGLCLVALLYGCATPLRQDRLVVAPNPTSSHFPGALANAMCAREVKGADQEDSQFKARITDSGFRKALVASLDANGLNAGTGSCKYPVDVNILGVSQPTFAWDMTVTVHTNYKVYDVSGRAVLLETVSAPFTATTSDASYGPRRFQLALEGAIRESISVFLEKLRGL